MTLPAIADSRDIVRPHKYCRSCHDNLPEPYLDLGNQPLANALRSPDDYSKEVVAPLAVACCKTCGLSQLTVVVEPDVLYGGYRFRSGESVAWKQHCENMAKEFQPFGRNRMLDIAANDGTCMDAFAAGGWNVRGVDPFPARKDILRGYWPQAVQTHQLNLHRADLIVAQNVLGHVDRPIPFLRGIKNALAKDGVAIIEVPDVEELLGNGMFDTIYHEHLSYWSEHALARACVMAGLYVLRCDRVPVHGGSLRMVLTPDGKKTTYQRPPRSRPPFGFAEQTATTIAATASLLSKLGGKKVVAYGASAKGAVMLNAVSSRCLCPLPSYVIDDCEAKQDLLMPGVGIPTSRMPDSLASVDVVWLLSWNNADGLKAKTRERGFAGKFLLTHPNVRLED